MLFSCTSCGRVAYDEDPEADLPCLPCAGYWFAHLGWVPRLSMVPVHLGQSAAPRRSRVWVFRDTEGRAVLQWPPPAEEGREERPA